MREGKRISQVAALRPRGLVAWALLLMVTMAGSARAALAASCPALPDMKLSHLRGTVYGPSGVPVPQILIKLMRDGTFVSQTTTDNKGNFEFRVAPGNVDVRVQFLGTKSLDIPILMVRSLGLFHSARLRVVLGLSGTKCSFATTSKKQFKTEMARYRTRLEEVQSTAP